MICVFNRVFQFFILLIMIVGELNAQESKYIGLKRIKAFEPTSEEQSEITIFLLINPHGHKVGYTANLKGDVCLDGLCRPIDIDIYWDLLGNFKDYETSPENVLTKFDHVPLTMEDHAKLRGILADESSLLQDYEVEDLIDTTAKISSSLSIDAVTGATRKSFEGAVVSGAVYTVYKLWHFVNGELRKEILEYSQANVFTDEEVKRLLLSGNRDYQRFLIDGISNARAGAFKKELTQLIDSDDDFIPLYAISKLPDSVWNDKLFLTVLLKKMLSYKNAVRIGVLGKLLLADLSANTLKDLMVIIPELSGKQLELAFSILDNNRILVGSLLLDELHELARSDRVEVRTHANDLMHQL